MHKAKLRFMERMKLQGTWKKDHKKLSKTLAKRVWKNCPKSSEWRRVGYDYTTEQDGMSHLPRVVATQKVFA